MSPISVSALIFSDSGKSHNGFSLVYKLLTQFGFKNIHEISSDFQLESKLINKIVSPSVLLIDARKKPFLFDYRQVRNFLQEKKPVLFLKYHSSPPNKAIGMNENGDIQVLNTDEKKEWADAFSFENIALLSQEEFRLQGHNCRSVDELFHSLLTKPARGIPVPEYSESPLKPCLFLDRDGIINEDTSYLSKTEDLKIISDVVPLITWAKEQGWYIIVVSNQSGLSRGKFSWDELQILTEHLKSTLHKLSAAPDAWFYCPYFEGGAVSKYSLKSVSRKPLPGMFLQAAQQVPIDFDRSFMVGDKVSDCVHLLGMQSFLVKGRYPLSGKTENVFENLRDALSHLKVRTSDRAKLDMK